MKHGQGPRGRSSGLRGHEEHGSIFSNFKPGFVGWVTNSKESGKRKKKQREKQNKITTTMAALRHGDVRCAIPALQGLRQEDHKREDSLGYPVRPRLDRQQSEYLGVMVSFSPRKGGGL